MRARCTGDVRTMLARHARWSHLSSPEDPQGDMDAPFAHIYLRMRAEWDLRTRAASSRVRPWLGHQTAVSSLSLDLDSSSSIPHDVSSLVSTTFSASPPTM